MEQRRESGTCKVWRVCGMQGMRQLSGVMKSPLRCDPGLFSLLQLRRIISRFGGCKTAAGILALPLFG